MSSIYWFVLVLSFLFNMSCGIQVQWSTSSPRECAANDTISGICTRSRTVQCVKSQSGQIIPDYYCNDLSNKPQSFIKCDTQNCPGRCVVSMWSPWQPCDVACSRSFTYRTRGLLWRDDDAGACPPLLEKKPCAQCAQNSNEFYQWRVGKWGTCRAFTKVTVYDISANQSDVLPSGSDVCGRFLKLGKATRKVKCVDLNGVEQKARKCLNSKDRDGRITQRPDRSKVCLYSCDCYMSAWSSWNGCPSDCSRTEESRTRGILYPSQLGGKPCGKLVEKRACNTRDCPRYKWYTSVWGECRSQSIVNGSACGSGFQDRVVFCIKSNSGLKVNEIRPVVDHLCKVVPKPVAKRPCKNPCPRDCVVSDWNEWEPCSVSCGSSAVKRRTRNVLQATQPGGADCPSLVQMSPCEVVPCTSWFKKMWSACLATTCGVGTKWRLVYCLGKDRSASVLSEEKCSHHPKPITMKDCVLPCPNDCALSSWGSWGACSKSCGKQEGAQTRKRSILAYPGSLRSACPTADKLIETRKCNVGKLCENEAAYMWKTTKWGACEAHVNNTCGVGKGTKKRKVHCGNAVKNFDNNTLCVNMSKPAEEAKCDVACPKDCVLSKWEKWSECNAKCGNQDTQISRRYVLQDAAFGGRPCPMYVRHGVEVNIKACVSALPCYNYTWRVTPWQKCQLLPQSKSTPPTCGSGYQVRNISCVRSDGELVETSRCFESSLESPPKALKECWEPCDDHCVRTSWSEWSDCPNRCTRTAPVRARSRQVVDLSPARGGFSATCPKHTSLDLTEIEDCPKIPCKSYKWYAASFGSCIPKDSTSSCGQGLKQRHVLCQEEESNSSFVDESLCDKRNKPNSWASCHIDCTEDCLVSAWGEWDQKCSNACGDSLRTRHRTVLKQPVGVGRACPSLVDKQLCREPACTSFKWSVDDIWSTCKLESNSSICGNGTQTRDVVCSPDPAREWICMRQAPKPATFQKCSLACPGECAISDWSQWSACVPGKDGCRQFRWRNSVRDEHATSTVKCSDFKLKETKNCTCLSTGKLVTSDWSSCQLTLLLGANCGKGMQYRSVKCEGDNGVIVDSKYCPNFDSTLPHRDCEIPCPIDCVMENWSEWSSCTSDCGLDGKIQRSRNVIVAAQNGGRKCAEGTQFRPCNGVPCYTYSLAEGRWSKCYVDGQGCGEGSQTRETTCRRSDGEIVSLHFCFGQLKKSSDDLARLDVLQDIINNRSRLSLSSSRSCDVPCPGDCHMSDWSEWSECGRNCFDNSTKYQQSRSRVVISKPDAGGKACSWELYQTRQCQPSDGSSPCIGARWRTGSWQGNGTRAVWCETSSGVPVTGACAAQNEPSPTMNCDPKCSDPNSVCQEGRCRCKPNYEHFHRQCIPTNGCLQDDHCIMDNMKCENQKCVCRLNFIWNSTVGLCVQGQKGRIDPPTTPLTAAKIQERTTKISKDVVSTSRQTVFTKKAVETTQATSGEKDSTTDWKIISTELKTASTTKNVLVKERLEEEGTISPEFWKWIGIGAGALVFFLILAIGFYCYTRQQRKAKHKMLRLKRNTVELVGLTYADDGKPAKV